MVENVLVKLTFKRVGTRPAARSARSAVRHIPLGCVLQVWLMPTVWKGYVKCILKTQPKSFDVVKHLPVPQLEELLQASCRPCRPWRALPLCSHALH